MGKRLLTIYVDDGDVELAKSKGINLSLFFRNLLKQEVSGDMEIKEDKDLILTLKNRIANLSIELEKKTIEIRKLQKEINNREEEWTSL